MKKPLKDLTLYHYKAMDAFFNFLKDGDEDKLMNELYSIETHWKSWHGIQRTTKNIWFRFFHNDTAATTIENIKTDLHSPNREHILACMKVCYELAEIEVYFS
jgi:hypothetical protein